MADKTVFYIVRSTVDPEHAEAFNRWYHEKHIPEMLELSGCISARRFKAIEADDKFIYMAVYEFENKEVFLKYQGSEQKKYLIKDYRENFGDKSELTSSSWEQWYP
jgi:antibiotic biosynthesis monooxygenase (ABM) superfamily enzyme